MNEISIHDSEHIRIGNAENLEAVQVMSEAILRAVDVASGYGPKGVREVTP